MHSNDKTAPELHAGPAAEDSTARSAGSGDARFKRMALQLAEMLTTTGHPPNRHRTHVSTVLGVSYNYASRRLDGEIAFDDDEIERICASVKWKWVGCGLQPIAPSSSAGEQPAEYRSGVEHVAKIIIAGLELDCIVEEAARAGIPPAADGLALQIDDHGQRQVVRNTAVSESGRAGGLVALARIEIRPSYAKTGPRIAILDDDASVCEGLTTMLSAQGFRVQCFREPEALLTRCRQFPSIDALLLDFTLEDDVTIEKYLEPLREALPNVGMVLMSGHFDEVNEVDDAGQRLAEAFNMEVLGKPAPTLAITRALKKSIAASALRGNLLAPSPNAKG